MYNDFNTQINLGRLNNPFTLLNSLSPEGMSTGTQTREAYFNVSDYIWENHSNFFSLLRRFNTLKSYEKKYKEPSRILLDKWLNNNLSNRDQYINDWLTIYLQIKNYINE